MKRLIREVNIRYHELRRSIESQRAVMNKLKSSRTDSRLSRETVEAKSNRLENIGIEYEERFQNLRTRETELNASHQGILQDRAHTKQEEVQAHEQVALPEWHSRGSNSVGPTSYSRQRIPEPKVSGCKEYTICQSFHHCRS